MGRLVDDAVAHFKSLPTREISIPEWNDEKYFVKNLTLADMAKLRSRSGEDNEDYFVYAIIFGLVDGEGEPVADIGDKHKLKSFTSHEVTRRIALEILSHQTQTEEEREKN